MIRWLVMPAFKLAFRFREVLIIHLEMEIANTFASDESMLRRYANINSRAFYFCAVILETRL